MYDWETCIVSVGLTDHDGTSHVEPLHLGKLFVQCSEFGTEMLVSCQTDVPVPLGFTLAQR